MKFEYKLSTVHSNIFVLEVDNLCDLGMIFVRAQEFYESANDKFHGKEFTLLSYMDWYSKEYSEHGGFTYGGDFHGFNVPSTAIKNCYTINTERTPYDELFLNVCQTIADLGVTRYYLLGVEHGDLATLEHEFAHALFFTDDKYRETMTRLVTLLPFQADFFSFLQNEFEYAKNVHIDEAQAYMATGFTEDFSDASEDRVKEYEPFTGPFKEVFQEWRKEISSPTTLKVETVDFFDNKP